MIVVGSKALQYYIPNLGRTTHDWDIYMSSMDFMNLDKSNMKFIKKVPSAYIYEVNGEIVEIKTEHEFEPTDSFIFDNTNYPQMLSEYPVMNTPIGKAIVPSRKFIFIMKAATVPFIDEPKHKHDLDLIIKTWPEIAKATQPVLQMRLDETRVRTEASKKVKYDFFYKYHIPEYIVHDYLHEIIAAGINLNFPTYKRITDGEVSIAESLFNNLTHEQKVSLMVEESLVLALERWFIPQMVENGINFKLLEMFDNNNEGFPTYQILKHCCITGLKGEAEYITGFARANFFEIEQEWIKAKAKIKANGGFPSTFFDKLFQLRKDYKAGKTVSIT